MADRIFSKTAVPMAAVSCELRLPWVRELWSRPTGGKQIDEIRASGSYQSASEPVVHFGLGKAQHANRLTVRFPNGHSRTFDNVRANQLLAVVK